MARKRFLSPHIWGDSFFVKLSPHERLLFIGMITLADDEGRLRASPSYLKGEIFPEDGLSDAKVEALRARITSRSRSVQLYKVAGIEYVQLRNWPRYQSPSHATPSRLPPPRGFKTVLNAREDGANPSRNPPEVIVEDTGLGLGVGRGMGLGMGKGSDSGGGGSVIPSSITDLFSTEIAPLTPELTRTVCGWLERVPVAWIEDAIHAAAANDKRTFAYVAGAVERHMDEELGFRETS